MNYDFDMNVLLQAMRDGSTQEEIANKFAAAGKGNPEAEGSTGC